MENKPSFNAFTNSCASSLKCHVIPAMQYIVMWLDSLLGFGFEYFLSIRSIGELNCIILCGFGLHSQRTNRGGVPVLFVYCSHKT
jgi:hypothetical protein